MKAVIFDTETTGLLLPSSAPIESQPRIIELGIVVVEDGKIVGEHNWLINPEREITAEITKITGITNDDLKDKPLFRHLLPEIEDVFGNSDYGFAHNAPFDYGMIGTELALISRTGFPWPRTLLCTANEFSHLFGRQPRLTELYKHFVGVELAQTHRALDDAIAVYEVLKKADYFSLLA